ncbi:MAG: TIGR03905 family TSCPD domain-containing protein [Anaerotignum sp.]|nr:TIGR03905 family TSCPD domain-containing protein [Anaerotignum sp.]
MHYNFNTKGVCAARLEFDVEDGVIKNVAFLGGCEGNHRGLAALAEGMTPDEAVKRLRGITCGTKKSSCPDQLAVALEEFVKNQK